VLFSNLSQPQSCSPKTIEILLYEVQMGEKNGSVFKGSVD